MKQFISLGNKWRANYMENGIFTLLDLCIECAEKTLERAYVRRKVYLFRSQTKLTKGRK